MLLIGLGIIKGNNVQRFNRNLKADSKNVLHQARLSS